MKSDLLTVIEAAYRLEASPADWLRDVGAAAYDQIGAGLGLLGFHYRVTPEARLEVLGDELHLGMPDAMGSMRGGLEQMPPEFTRKTFVRCEATTTSHGGDATVRAYARATMEPLAAAFGWHDVLMLGGVDPTNQGVYLGAWLPKVTRLDPRTRATLSRVAVHLVTADRLRRRLAAADAQVPDTADAVLTPSGRVEHAQNDAELQGARTNLRDSVVGLESARGRMRRSDPHRAVDLWKGLVAGRWTLVDHFQSDGKRYVLARRNDVPMGGFEALTLRERQALGHAALGHSNKLIAYEMGIAPSTVAVLLYRAAQRLSVRSRTELIDRFVSLAPTPTH